MSNLKASYVYAYHVTSHNLIKVGYGDSPKDRLASYCAIYGIAADSRSLRIWDFPAAGVASVIEGTVHRSLADAGFAQHLIQVQGQEAQELFELGNHSYSDALLIVAEAIEDATNRLLSGLKGKANAAGDEWSKQRRDEIRQEKADERHQAVITQRAIEQSRQQDFLAEAAATWNSEVQPWLTACQRAESLMKDKRLMTGLFSFVTGRDVVEELRKRDIYPAMLKLIEQMFFLARVTRAWRLRLVQKYGYAYKGSNIDLQFPGGQYLAEDSLHDHIDEESIIEVRLAVQSATGWSGVEALALMKKDPMFFNRLVNYAKDNPSPERASGKTWVAYTTKGEYVR